MTRANRKNTLGRRVSARLLPAIAMGAVVFGAGQAQAIIVAGNPGQNAPDQSTAPAGFEDAWNRLGSLGGGSGVYLGNGYVLSARHVNGGSVFTVDGFTHSRINGTSVTLSNPDGLGLTEESDLWINRYRIPDDSPLAGLGVIALRDTPLAGAGAGGIIIGEGVGQVTTTPVNVGGGLQGYAWSNDEQRRWGETIASSSAEVSVTGRLNGEDVTRDVIGVASFGFQQIAGRANASVGDSGGGLFYMGPDGPVLSGIIHAVTLAQNQNDDTTGFGSTNRTLFSDISAYLDQIRVVEGDLTGDGFVGIDDLDLVLANWGDNVADGNWTLGDANGDGTVGQADLDYVINNFGAGTPPPAIVPEPASGGLLALTFSIFTRRRRRRRDN